MLSHDDWEWLAARSPGVAAQLWPILTEGYGGRLMDDRFRWELDSHLRDTVRGLNVLNDTPQAYFGSTYLHTDVDRVVKRRINEAVQALPSVVGAKVENSPDPRHLAVVSGRWVGGHSVHRTLQPYVAALTWYKKTLVTFNQPGVDDTDGFDEVIPLVTDKYVLDFDPIRKNTFGAAYFPDVGMTPESIILANVRLAPVMAMGTGHPVSTFGSKIDYFLGGRELRLGRETATYSEKVWDLDGLGACYLPPTFRPVTYKPSGAGALVNCSWYGQKVNHRSLSALRRISEAADRPVKFQLFAGCPASVGNSTEAFQRRVNAVVGPKTDVQVYGPLPYDQYMEKMSWADMALDSFPFSGSNTVSDNIWLRKPTVTYDCPHWYGRVGSALVRRWWGDETMIAKDFEEYVRKAVITIGHLRPVQQMAEQRSIEPVYSAAGAESFQHFLDLVTPL